MRVLKDKNQKGIAHFGLILGLVIVLGAVGFVGYRVMNKENTSSTTQQTAAPAEKPEGVSSVTWEYDGSQWKASGMAPACPEPIQFESPVDVSKTTAILYPGQTRGGQYKPHGGFRFDSSANSDITVKAPIQAQLIEGSRYIEQGEVQYLLGFIAPCGIMYRFDHLLTLSDKFQSAVDATLPAAKVDDSRTTKFSPSVDVKAGDVIAKAVGFKSGPNVSLDFGVYNLRSPNEASKVSSWANLHQSDKQLSHYAVCWFNLLPSADSSKVKSLPAGDSTSGKTSDYCK